jgi:hypothetical protein
MYSESRMGQQQNYHSLLDADLPSVVEEGSDSAGSGQVPFSKAFVTIRQSAEGSEHFEQVDYFEDYEIIEGESHFVHDVAATPPTPSTPSFAESPRPGSAGSRKTEDGESDPIKEMLGTVAVEHPALDLEDIGSTTGLTQAQVAGRKLLKVRNLYRMSRGEGRGPIHLDHMGMLLRAFDDLVVEYGDKAQQEMKGPEFWERFDQIEDRIAKQELLEEAEKQFQ